MIPASSSGDWSSSSSSIASCYKDRDHNYRFDKLRFTRREKEYQQFSANILESLVVLALKAKDFHFGSGRPRKSGTP